MQNITAPQAQLRLARPARGYRVRASAAPLRPAVGTRSARPPAAGHRRGRAKPFDCHRIPRIAYSIHPYAVSKSLPPTSAPPRIPAAAPRGLQPRTPILGSRLRRHDTATSAPRYARAPEPSRRPHARRADPPPPRRARATAAHRAAAAQRARGHFSRGGHVPFWWVIGKDRNSDTQFFHKPTQKKIHTFFAAIAPASPRHGGPMPRGRCSPRHSRRTAEYRRRCTSARPFLWPSGRAPRSPVRVPPWNPRKANVPSWPRHSAPAAAGYGVSPGHSFLAIQGRRLFRSPSFRCIRAVRFAGTRYARALRGNAATRQGRGKHVRANTRAHAHRAPPTIARGSCARLPEYRPDTGRLRRNTARKRQPRNPSARALHASPPATAGHAVRPVQPASLHRGRRNTAAVSLPRIRSSGLPAARHGLRFAFRHGIREKPTPSYGPRHSAPASARIRPGVRGTCAVGGIPLCADSHFLARAEGGGFSAPVIPAHRAARCAGTRIRAPAGLARGAPPRLRGIPRFTPAVAAPF